ncbi:MAG TPA: hypothetical protein VF058_01885 [Actinomycetota bacterium]
MKTFIVHGTNRAGELAKITGALSSKGVNVLISAFGENGRALAGFVASDETSAQEALKDSGFEYKMWPAVTVRLSDTPGQVAEISRKLGDAGINIECFLPVSMTEDKVIAAIGVEDIEGARKALVDHVVEYAYS